ncbi:hypothetical protein D3C84_714140 [compost metagenome]
MQVLRGDTAINAGPWSAIERHAGFGALGPAGIIGHGQRFRVREHGQHDLSLWHLFTVRIGGKDHAAFIYGNPCLFTGRITVGRIQLVAERGRKLRGLGHVDINGQGIRTAHDGIASRNFQGEIAAGSEVSVGIERHGLRAWGGAVSVRVLAIHVDVHLPGAVRRLGVVLGDGVLVAHGVIDHGRVGAVVTVGIGRIEGNLFNTVTIDITDNLHRALIQVHPQIHVTGRHGRHGTIFQLQVV